MKDEPSLGSIALIRAGGNPNEALAELMSQVMGMCGFIHFIHKRPEALILKAYDALCATARESLIEILKEEETKCES